MSNTENGSIAKITSSMLSKRGSDHTKLGEHVQALECHRKALALHKMESSSSGTGTPQNEETANHYDNLGAAYQKNGGVSRAVFYFHKALTIRLNQNNGNEDHISVAGSYDNIANAYSDQGDFHRALNFHHKSKHIKKKLLGRQHKDTARTFWHIGDVHYRRGEEDDALLYFYKALEIQKKVLHEKHSDTAKTQESIDLIVKDDEAH